MALKRSGSCGGAPVPAARTYSSRGYRWQTSLRLGPQRAVALAQRCLRLKAALKPNLTPQKSVAADNERPPATAAAAAVCAAAPLTAAAAAVAAAATLLHAPPCSAADLAAAASALARPPTSLAATAAPPPPPSASMSAAAAAAAAASAVPAPQTAPSLVASPLSGDATADLTAAVTQQVVAAALSPAASGDAAPAAAEEAAAEERKQQQQSPLDAVRAALNVAGPSSQAGVDSSNATGSSARSENAAQADSPAAAAAAAVVEGISAAVGSGVGGANLVEGAVPAAVSAAVPPWWLARAPIGQGAWQAYCSSLAIAPLPTKVATGVMGAFLGDLLAQFMAHERAVAAAATHRRAARASGSADRASGDGGGGGGGGARASGSGGAFEYDAPRFARLAAFTAVLGAPINHYWYALLDASVLPSDPCSPAAIAAKLALDQILQTPLSTALFLATMPALEGRARAAAAEVRQKLLPSLAANWLVWGPVQLANFALVPGEARILFINLVAVFWTAYISTVSAAAPAAPAAAQAAAEGGGRGSESSGAPVHRTPAAAAEGPRSSGSGTGSGATAEGVTLAVVGRASASGRPSL